MNEGKAAAAHEWTRGWTLVLAAAVGFSFMSVMTTAMGAFIGPLVAEFHWNRTTVSLGMPIAGILSVLFSPFVGVFVDRYGARRLALPGLVALIAATCAFSTANGSVTQWVILWLVYSVATLAVTISVWTAAVAGAFSAGRGLAIGLTLSGTAVAQGIAPVIATRLIDLFGWRQAYVMLGLGWGGVALVLCMLFFHDPRGRAASLRERLDTSHLEGLTLAQAWRDPGLWRIALTTFVLMLLTIGLLIHQIPIMVEAGVSPQNAALLVMLSGAAGIVGKLATGWLIDRYSPNWVGAITLGVAGFAFAMLIDGVRTMPLIILAMVINGYSSGTKLQICSYLTARYAGLKNFGKIFGTMGSLIALGSALGPLIAGRVYDLWGSYDPFLIVGAIGCVLCGALILTLPGYPDWARQKEGEPSLA